jgi:hypothetical protein
LVYTRLTNRPNPVPKEFLPTSLGADCDIDEVSVTAMTLEYNQEVFNRVDREDPWYAALQGILSTRSIYFSSSFPSTGSDNNVKYNLAGIR